MDSDRTRIYLTRHGEVENHSRHIYNGHTDVDITPKGVEQMERLKNLLQEKKLAAVYCSDLLRTKKGAEMIAQSQGLEYQAFPHFRELHFGQWQGLSLAEVTAQYPSDLSQWMKNLETFRVPGGESIGDMRNRAIPKLQELLEGHRGQEFALVCHGGLNRLILAEALHLPIAHLLRIWQDYGCLNIVEYTPTWSEVKLING